jgi:hypothetical protein
MKQKTLQCLYFVCNYRLEAIKNGKEGVQRRLESLSLQLASSGNRHVPSRPAGLAGTQTSIPKQSSSQYFVVTRKFRMAMASTSPACLTWVTADSRSLWNKFVWDCCSEKMLFFRHAKLDTSATVQLGQCGLPEKRDEGLWFNGLNIRKVSSKRVFTQKDTSVAQSISRHQFFWTAQHMPNNTCRRLAREPGTV